MAQTGLPQRQCSWVGVLCALLLGPLHVGGEQQRSDTTVKLANAPCQRGVATLVPELSIGVVEGEPESAGQRVDPNGRTQCTAWLRAYDRQLE